MNCEHATIKKKKKKKYYECNRAKYQILVLSISHNNNDMCEYSLLYVMR